MPVRFLTAEQERRYGKYVGEPNAEQLARYFHLSEADKVLVARRRGIAMRIGFAVQLGTVRFLGTFLDNPADTPARIITYVMEQFEITADNADLLKTAYTGRIVTQHAAEIREHYGYRSFNDGYIRFCLNRWLYALCWTGTDRPSVLFDRATAWLVTQKILLPGVTILEKTISRVRSRANKRLWQVMTRGVTTEQAKQLEALLIPETGKRYSTLERLRQQPVRQSVPGLTGAIRRVEEIKELSHAFPGLSHVPSVKIRNMACFADISKAQAIARLPQKRRIATLLAFIHILEATAQDDVLDLFDIIAGKIFKEAKAVEQKVRLRTLHDLDEAALKLLQACQVILDQECADSEVRKTIFEIVSHADLQTALKTVDALVQPPDDTYFTELRIKYPSVRRFLPSLVETLTFGANPAGQSVLDALHYLRSRKKQATPPTAFMPRSWRKKLKPEEPDIDPQLYALCFLDVIRNVLRRRDIFISPSLKYADPRIGLIEGTAWEMTRPTICKTLGRSPNAEGELEQLTKSLADSYQTVAANLPANGSVRIEFVKGKEELVLTGLEKLEEPFSLLSLRDMVNERLPRVDLPKLILEISTRTGFTKKFTHVSENEARAANLDTSLCAVLLAEACNTGLEPLVRSDIPALRRSRLSWVRQNYIRPDTLIAANAVLVSAQNRIHLTKHWGGGEVASADGLRFVVPVRSIHAGANPKYFGIERGVTYYNLVSDQFTGLGSLIVTGTLRDSLVLLATVLEQQTELDPTEIMTDTGAYTDTMFGIFWLLGYQFSPRLADIGGTRFWCIDPKADYGCLNFLCQGNKIKTTLIEEHWDDLLRLAGSLKLGTVQVSSLIRSLQTNQSPTKLARALEELGRIIKTLYLLRYIDSEAYRRRILTQLNRGEGRHQVARTIFHGKHGELRQPYRQGQEDQLGALGLVTNMVILWNTLYMNAAIEQLRNEGHLAYSQDIARLSPLAHEHINMLGRYSFTLSQNVADGNLRPLRNPQEYKDDI